MPAEKIALSALGLDLSPRITETHTVVGSPAAAAETTIASLTLSQNAAFTTGVLLEAWCAVTVGTNGTAVTMKIHHTDAAGATIASTGACTATAANLITISCQGLDAVPVLPGQIYIVTLQVTSGSATSTVSGTSLWATVI